MLTLPADAVTLHHATLCRLVHAGVSDRGVQRSHNEDRYGIFPETGLFVVADGMGGEAAGEVAARMTVELAHEALAGAGVPTTPGGEAIARLVHAIEQANESVHYASLCTPEQRGMGTTVAALLACGHRAALAHVGDSRIYRLRGRRLVQLTEDHSLFNELVRAGRADPDRPEAFLHHNVITRAVGADPFVDVDARLVDAAPGDTFLLCSDGLSGVLAHDELTEIVIAHADLDAAAERLVARANELGGPDNITAVLVRWEEACAARGEAAYGQHRDAA